MCQEDLQNSVNLHFQITLQKFIKIMQEQKIHSNAKKKLVDFQVTVQKVR